MRGSKPLHLNGAACPSQRRTPRHQPPTPLRTSITIFGNPTSQQPVLKTVFPTLKFPVHWPMYFLSEPIVPDLAKAIECIGSVNEAISTQRQRLRHHQGAELVRRHHLLRRDVRCLSPFLGAGRDLIDRKYGLGGRTVERTDSAN